MSLAFDEFGRPFIILKVNDEVPFLSSLLPFQREGICLRAYSLFPHTRSFLSDLTQLFCSWQEQEKKQRIRGIDAQRAHIKAAKAIARILRSSLGPNGMDKLLQGPDGDVCISKLFLSSAVEVPKEQSGGAAN